MEAKELRIGNLISRTNKLTTEKLTIELTASCILDISANGQMSGFIYEPISLTEEWLLKLGFWTISDGGDDGMRYIKGFQLWKCNDLWLCNKNGVVIKSIHQLQNLYFALTGNELIINT